MFINAKVSADTSPFLYFVFIALVIPLETVATDTAPPCPAAPKRNAAPCSFSIVIPKSLRASSVIFCCNASVAPPTPVARATGSVIPNDFRIAGVNLLYKSPTVFIPIVLTANLAVTASEIPSTLPAIRAVL